MASKNDNANAPIPAKGYAVDGPESPFRILDFERRAPRDDDVVIRIHYCGVCHTDIHYAHNDWQNAVYPMVPGHEITGVVEKVGSKVKKFSVGDHVGVGCMVDSCRGCKRCKKDLEQYCADSVVTYNGKELETKTNTLGGYSNVVTVRDQFVCKIPSGLPLDGAAPLLCAGITTYSPLHQHKVGKNTRMGVVGLGGLGHMAVKFGAAMGAHVTVISTSESKRDDAIKLGAKAFLVSKDKKQLEAAKDSFDFIIDTVAAAHDVAAMVDLLDFEGTICMIGAPPEPIQIAAMSLLKKRPVITGSLIGGMAETQEMLDFCGKHKITSDIEKIAVTPESIKSAYERTTKSDVKYRFVLDILSAFK